MFRPTYWIEGLRLSVLHEFKLWGQDLLSDLDLGLLETRGAGSCSTAVRIQGVQPHRMHELTRTESLDCTNQDGSIWLTISRSGPAYVLDFPNLCSFHIDPGALLIEYAPEPGASTSTTVHMLLDHALPRLVSLLKDYFVLHASAWIVGDTAVMALGQSGAGKSTLAGWMGTHGFPIVTDDCLVLHHDPHRPEWVALPSYASVRLWPDSIDAMGIDAAGLREVAHYSTKRRTAQEQDSLRFAGGPVPLGSAFVLKPGDQDHCSVDACPVDEAFGALSQSVFRLEIASPEMNRREFEILTDLVEKTPFWSISHGTDYTKLPELQQRILEVLR